jgi:hypothetical protein
VKYKVTFSAKQERRLGEMAQIMRTTKAEVLRMALAVLSVIVRETAGTNKIVQLVDPKGRSEPIDIWAPRSKLSLVHSIVDTPSLDPED